MDNLKANYQQIPGAVSGFADRSLLRELVRNVVITGLVLLSVGIGSIIGGG